MLPLLLFGHPWPSYGYSYPVVLNLKVTKYSYDYFYWQPQSYQLFLCMAIPKGCSSASKLPAIPMVLPNATPRWTGPQPQNYRLFLWRFLWLFLYGVVLSLKVNGYSCGHSYAIDAPLPSWRTERLRRHRRNLGASQRERERERRRKKRERKRETERYREILPLKGR
jgi:hypothetical protein